MDTKPPEQTKTVANFEYDGTYKLEEMSLKRLRNAPRTSYYSKEGAAWLLPILMRMHAGEYNTAVFDPIKFGLSVSSLQQKILHAWNYIIDHVDRSTKKWMLLRIQCQISQKRSGLVSIERIIKPDVASVSFTNQNPTPADQENPPPTDEELMKKLEDYINTASTGSVFLVEFEATTQQLKDMELILMDVLGDNGNQYRWQLTKLRLKIQKLP